MGSPATVTTDRWESDVLGLRVGRAALKAPSELPQVRDGLDVIYCSAPSPVPLSSAPPGWQSIGPLVTLVADVTPSPDGEPGVLPAVHVGGMSERIGFGGRYARDQRLCDAGPRVFDRWLLDALADPQREVLVAATGAGVVVLRRGQPARIELVGVDPQRRGEGVGRRLVAAAVSAAARGGAAQIQVGAYGDNEPALRLYRAAGFTAASTEWRYHWWPAQARA